MKLLITLFFLIISLDHAVSDDSKAKPDHKLEAFECWLEYGRYSPSMDPMEMEEIAKGPIFSPADNSPTKISFKNFVVSIREIESDCASSRLGCTFNLQIEHGDSTTSSVIKLSTKRSSYVPKSSFSFTHGKEKLDVRCYFKD